MPDNAPTVTVANARIAVSADTAELERFQRDFERWLDDVASRFAEKLLAAARGAVSDLPSGTAPGRPPDPAPADAPAAPREHRDPDTTNQAFALGARIEDRLATLTEAVAAIADSPALRP